MSNFNKTTKKLESLSLKFEAWRKTKKCRTDPIPVNLAAAAVSLEPFLGRKIIENKLRVQWESLSNKLNNVNAKKQKKQSAIPEFVDLTNLISGTESLSANKPESADKISIHTPEGIRIEWELSSDSIMYAMQLCASVINQNRGA